MPSRAVARPTTDRSTDHSRPPPRGTTARSPKAPAAWGRREQPVVLDRPPPTAPGFRKQARSIARGQPYYRATRESTRRPGCDAPSKPPSTPSSGQGPKSSTERQNKAARCGAGVSRGFWFHENSVISRGCRAARRTPPSSPPRPEAGAAASRPRATREKRPGGRMCLDLVTDSGPSPSCSRRSSGSVSRCPSGDSYFALRGYANADLGSLLRCRALSAMRREVGVRHQSGDAMSGAGGAGTTGLRFRAWAHLELRRTCGAQRVCG